MRNRFKFSEEQKQNIKEAIADLETHSSGEIVPYFTHRSDEYFEARWKCAVLLSVFGALLLAIASYTWMLPFAVTPLEDAIYIGILMLIGFFIPVIFPSTIRFFLSEDSLHARVMSRAMSVFLQEEIFKTRDRTGVLIYVSELEHEVVVLADSGINAKVTSEDWQNVTSLVTEGIKEKQVDKGLINAIAACKKLLLQNGFTVRPDDTNELSDELRID